MCQDNIIFKVQNCKTHTWAYQCTLDTDVQ